MFDPIKDKLKKAKNMDEVQQLVLEHIREVKEKEKLEKLGFVSGMITSEGPEHVDKNNKRLAHHTHALKRKHKFYMVSSPIIFKHVPEDKLEEAALTPQERYNRFIEFWRAVLGCGHITDIFMTPRWEKSIGAIDEHEVAKKLNLNIHYVEE